MINWKPPCEQPKCDVGDRIVCVIKYRERVNGPLSPHVVILEATEFHGFTDNEGGGFSFEDCEWWAYEKELIRG